MDENFSPLFEDVPPKEELLRAAYAEQARYLRELLDQRRNEQKRRARRYFLLQVFLGAAVLAWLIRLAFGK